MASIKFSAFTNEAVDAATTQLVGYKVGDATANYRYSIAQLATALSPSIDNFYSANGTIGTTRIAKVTDTVTFQNAGGTSSLFSLNTDGTFTLGHGATNAAGSSSVAIGISASTVAQYSVAIGRQAVVSNGMHTYSTVIGNQAGVLGGQSVSLGSYSAAGAYGVAIGHSAGGAGYPAINVGHSSQGTGNNAVTLNVSGAAATPSTQYAFGVYMTSNTTPDFQVVGGGESTLNTNLKVTGQAYSEQHDSLAGNATVDWNNGNNQYIQLASGANTFTPSNPLDGATYILQIKQPAAGAAGTVTWGATVKWPGAAAPTLTVTNNAIDVVTLVYNGTTTHYYATSILNLS